tara:strand:- start:6992 stop:8416 length:1425 start_codon:yes stop_codon:yes gene_type:complete
MKNLQDLGNKYYLNNSIIFFKNNFEKRSKFLKNKKFLFLEISDFINNCINESKKILLFCAGNSLISRNLKSNEIYIKEISDEYKINHKENIKYYDNFSSNLISECDNIIVADIEHQLNPAKNLLDLSNNINDDARIIILSKNIIWMILIKILKLLLGFSPKENNFLPSSYLYNLYSSCNLEIVRTERIIAFPVNIPILTNFINKLFRLPILNLLCVSSITILKKIQKNKEYKNQEIFSFIIPCKNEEKNIPLFNEKLPKNNKNYEFLFGDDNSSDNTKNEIIKLSKHQTDLNILRYDGPGICKSENVYKGIDMANGDVIIIYDADLTVDFKDIEFALNILKNTNTDFINCTRMIYPQKNKAMKTLNFFGNGFFGFLFSVLFKKKVTDTLCGTKIFYKKHWDKIKKGNGKWGAKDLWGDFDLLIGAYKNNLKITEVPVVYYERIEGETKMTSLFSNTVRMIWIVVSAYYKLRLKI